MTFQILKSKITLFIALIFCLLLFSYLYMAKFSLNEINADNYKENLMESNFSILIGNGLDYHIPDKGIPVAIGYELANSNNFQGNGLEINNTKHAEGESNTVVITSSRSRLVYNFLYSDQSLNFAWIHKYGLMDDTYPNTIFIKNIINQLILKDGFSLIRTNLKTGEDIIIKEIDQGFIIGSFNSYDSNIPPQSLAIKSYRKHKYLNSLRLD